MTGVRRVRPEEAERFRALRLRALRSDPQAFASAAEDEAAEPLESWRQRLSDDERAIFADEDFRGMAGGLRAGDEVELWGMWVEPEARGSGLARALVDAVVAWARASGAASVGLGVMNAADISAFYEHLGFTQADNPSRCDRWYRITF